MFCNEGFEDTDLGTVTNASKWKMKLEPVLDFNTSSRENTDKTVKKSCGFNLAPDATLPGVTVSGTT